MLNAIYKGELTHPRRGIIGTCDLCGEDVKPRCGKINVHHWTHKNLSKCESSDWHEPETPWHKYWKYSFGDGKYEQIINKGDEKHRADVRTTKGVIIELQHSSISPEVIKLREDFYGEKMIWVIDASKYTFVRLEVNTFWYDWSKDYSLKKNEQHFRWDYPLRSWREVRRPVFLDIGDEKMYLVRKGMMGYNRGIVAVYSKHNFFKHYGADLKYYMTNWELMYEKVAKCLYGPKMLDALKKI